MVVDDLVLLDPSDLRRDVVGGLSERILRARGGAGPSRPRPTRTRPSKAPTSSWSSCASGGRRRATSTRRSRSGTGASARRPRAPEGWPRRCAPCRSCSSWPRRWRPVQPRRVAGRLHQPGRDRHPGAARRGPPRRRPVQRRDLGPAADRSLSRCRPRRGRDRACRPEPSDVDPVGPGRADGDRGRRPARRSLRAFRTRARARERRPDRRCSACSTRCRRTTCTTTTSMTPRWRSSRRRVPVPSRCGGRVGGQLLEEYRDPRWCRSRRHCRTGAAPTTRWPPSA